MNTTQNVAGQEKQTSLENWKNLIQSENEEDRHLAFNMLNEYTLDNFHLPDLYDTMISVLQGKNWMKWEDMIRIKKVFREKGFMFWMVDFVK